MCLLHEKRGHNPYKSLQLHLLRAVHLRIADGILAVRRVGIEVFGTGIGEGKLGVIVAVVLKKQVNGLVGLHLVGEGVEVKDVRLLAVPFIYKQVIEREPALARHTVRHKTGN